MVAKDFKWGELIIIRFSLLVIKYYLIIILMLIGNNYNLKVKQLNVKTSFLYGYQKDTVYVQQHEDFLKFKKELILFYFFGKNYCRTLKMVHTQEI